MINPTPSDIGRRVIYRDRCGYVAAEEGVILWVYEAHVWVLYEGGAAPVATGRRDLEWVPPPLLSLADELLR